MIPRAKEYRETGGLLACHSLVLPQTEAGDTASRLLSLFLPSVAAGTGDTPSVTLACEALPAGAYRLTVTAEGGRITYGDREGLRNAVSTLASLYTDGGFLCAEIADAPSFGYRSAMLDLARGYVELPVLREHLVRMAFLKYNTVHFHLMDHESYVLESAVVPNPDGHRQYTHEQMREVCELCHLLSLQVIPEIEFPTHATNLLLALPELSCDIIDPAVAEAAVSVEQVDRSLLARDRGVSAWAVCVGSERTYEVYRRIIAELASVFPGPYIHLGGDEIAYPHLGAVPHWDNCRVCRACMAREGLSDSRALYYYGFHRLHAILAEFGKRMIKWNENNELSAPLPLPKDTVIEYWRPTPSLWADEERQGLCAAGYEVINAHYYYTYVDFANYMTAEKLNSWSPAAEGEATLGGETCAWELGNPKYTFYPYRLPLTMALFADRVWNRDAVPYDDGYRADLFAAALGMRGLGAAPLSPLPAILPQTTVGDKRGEAPVLSAVPAALLALGGVCGERVYGRLFLAAYREYLSSLLASGDNIS